MVLIGVHANYLVFTDSIPSGMLEASLSALAGTGGDINKLDEYIINSQHVYEFCPEQDSYRWQLKLPMSYGENLSSLVF